MAEPIAYYLALLEDKEAPPDPKPLLQQYDNYQIYDLYSTTISYKQVETNKPDVFPVGNTNIVAVQHYSATKPLCDFQQIAEEYK